MIAKETTPPVARTFELRDMDNCEHRWVSGDSHSDFICDECGERANLNED